MSHRRPKKRRSHRSGPPDGPDVFAECGLNAKDFAVELGGGKSILSGHRLVWMTLTNLPTGRKVSGKISTLKRRASQ